MRTAVKMLTVAVVLAGAGCQQGERSPETTTGKGGGATAPVAQTVRCSDLSDEQWPNGTLVSGDAGRLEQAGCRPVGGGAVLDGPVYVVAVGYDRNAMRLETEAGGAARVIVSVPGPTCATSADWRGRMALVWQSETPPAAVVVEQDPQPCS